MSGENAGAPASTSTGPPPAKSGVRIVLERSGIPSWLLQRPKLPSRNWLIFLSVTSSLTGFYFYDRRQCKRIRQEYVDKVKHLAEEPLGSLQLPRKVTVYGAKWPGDDDFDRSMKYFRKYVKPVLVAAAVDYEMIKGKRHGDIAERIADEIKAKRRLDVGLDLPPVNPMPLATALSAEDARRKELEGGIVLVGRPTFKEFMAGLKRGWTEGLERVDKEEKLSAELEDDGAFDEAEPEATFDPDGEPIPTASKLSPSIYSPIQARPPAARRATEKSSIPEHLNQPPSSIPAYPPLLLVPFINYLGIKQIPLMVWDFFNERHKVRAGAEVGYRLVMAQTRPFSGPPADVFGNDPGMVVADSDLDFDREDEAYYKSSTAKLPEEIEQARKEYNTALPARLKTARDLARGVREHTKDELNYPPPTEVELRAERIKKELRWRGDLAGWDIVRPAQPVAWDERFRRALSVFVPPPPQTDHEEQRDQRADSS